MDLTLKTFLFRLLVILILAGLIGLEREYFHRPAGLRTNILVGLGASLFSMLALALPQHMGSSAVIIGQIVTGIGFLGAGAIIHYGRDVQGLTTAATIWLVAGLGVAVGLGWYWPAAITTLITLVILLLIGEIEKALEHKKRS